MTIKNFDIMSNGSKVYVKKEPKILYILLHMFSGGGFGPACLRLKRKRLVRRIVVRLGSAGQSWGLSERHQ
jgi:hypothetical protein